MADSQVRITNVNGNVIYQTISNGGIATWDGMNADGSRVSSGVYLIMCTSPDGSQHAVTKLLVVK
jgi:hypothetical protein